jgi:hypothetical protein
MSGPGWKMGVAGLLISAGAVAQTAAIQEPALSPAEMRIVERQIATLESPGERHMAEGWSNAKKVAELICRPQALIVLKKQSNGVDKVFLGTDASDSLALESNHRLTGSGQFRAPQGWRDFTFTCDLNPETGRVTAFQPSPVSTPAVPSQH